MRYHLETIPVIDAYRAQSECPLCELEQQTENGYLESFLGESVMEPAVRIEVNHKGFCRPHFEKMLAMRNRLGLALMAHTHLMETMDALRFAVPAKKRAFARFAQKEKKEARSQCALCDRLADTMERYVLTALHLWKTNADFQKAFHRSKGHCLAHHNQLLEMAAKEFSTENARAFSQAIHQLQLQNMERIEKELKWFTEKFDYRNADKPWGESKDALERAINKLRGKHF